MAEIKSFPNNQDVYVGAEWVMKWLHGRTSGVFGAQNNASVSAVSGEMSVEVSDGIGWISNENGDGVVWWNDSEEQSGEKLKLSLEPADGSLARIDRVVVTWETTNFVALPSISVLIGTSAGNPVAPPLTNNGTQRQISLASIKIPAGTIALSPSMITDERLNGSVCGIVTEKVEVDTSMMQNQFDALLRAIQDQLASITGGTGFELAPVRFDNVNIKRNLFSIFSPSDEEESKMVNMGYSYRAAVNLDGILENMYPYITFSLYDVEESGVGVANLFKCYNGGVYVYSDGVPKTDILALTMEFRKMVSSGSSYNGVSMLNLEEGAEKSNAQAEIDGASYGVTNASVSVGTDGIYDFTVL